MNSGNRMNKWAAWVLVAGWALVAQAGYLPELTWLNPKPQGNAIRDMEFHASGNGVGYAVGDGGTALRYAPGLLGGMEWQPLINHDDTDLHGVSVVRDTTGKETVFCVGDNGTVLQATISPAQLVSELLPVFRPSVAPSKHLYGVDFISPKEGWVVGQGGEIWFVDLDSHNWTQKPTPGVNWLNDVCFPDVLTGYVVGDDGAIWKTTNQGDSWEALTLAPDLRARNYYAVYFPPGDAENGWVAGEGETLLRTTDGGDHWTLLNERKDTITGYYMYLNGRYVWVPNTVTMLSLNDFRKVGVMDQWGAAVGGWGAAQQATASDGGQAWTVKTQAGWPELHALALRNDVFHAAGEYGALLASQDHGATWAPKHKGGLELITDAHFINSSKAVAVGERGAIYRTTDGQNWSRILLPKPFNNDLLGVYFFGDTGCAVGGKGQIVRFTNAGANWEVRPAPTTVTLRRVHFPSSQVGYAVGDQGTILKTEDGGMTWSVCPRPTAYANLMLFGVWFVDNLTGVAVGDNGAILRTTNGGRNWVRVSSGTANRLLAVQFAGDFGWAVGEKGTILCSNNKGETWFAQTSGVTADSLNGLHMLYIRKTVSIPLLPTITVERYVGAVVGSRGTVLVTDSGGNVWHQEQARAAHPVTADLRDVRVQYDYATSRDGLCLKIKIDVRAWLFGAGGAILHGHRSFPSRRVCDAGDDVDIKIPPRYTIAGRIEGEIKPATNGVKPPLIVRLAGEESRTIVLQVPSDDIVTRSYYEFTELPAGNYSVTPECGNQPFTPEIKRYSPLGQDLRHEDFTIRH